MVVLGAAILRGHGSLPDAKRETVDVCQTAASDKTRPNKMMRTKAAGLKTLGARIFSTIVQPAASL